jgi:hypothetical protein
MTVTPLSTERSTGLGPIADEYLRLLRIAANIEKFTTRQTAAWEFLERFFEVALFYQRYSYTHFLVRKARDRYRWQVDLDELGQRLDAA